MQLNYRPAAVGSGTAYTVFADDLAVTAPRTSPDLIDYRPPGFQTAEQIEPLAGGLHRFVANRGNGVWRLQLPVRMWYATAAAARQAIPGLAAPWGLGLVDVQILDASAADAVYLPAASLGAFTPASGSGQQGVYLAFTLALTAPTFTLTAP